MYLAALDNVSAAIMYLLLYLAALRQTFVSVSGQQDTYDNLGGGKSVN